MIKKALFILASILLGFMLITNGYYLCFYNVFQAQNEKTVEEKNYLEAAKYYAYAFDYDNIIYTQTEEDGAHIDIYPAVNMFARKAEKEDKTTVQYDTAENSIQISLYHLPADFALVDKDPRAETPVRGGVELVYGDKTVFFPFVVYGATAAQDQSFYSYIEYYGYFPFTIYEADYTQALAAKEIAFDAQTTAINVIDGDGEVEYQLAVNTALFSTQFHSDYRESLNAYNETTKKDALAGTTSENLADLVKAINDVTTTKEYESQYSVDVVLKSSKFRWSFALMIGAFLVLDFLIGFLLFRKKKPSKFVPRRTMPTKPTNEPKLNYQPEQFSRKDFLDAEEEPALESEETTE